MSDALFALGFVVMCIGLVMVGSSVQGLFGVGVLTIFAGYLTLTAGITIYP